MAPGTKGDTRTSVRKSPLKKKITVKYLRLRWTYLGKKLPLSISGKDGPIRVKNHL